MEFVFIFLIGLVSGFLGGTVGGGGMVSLPALIFLGFPPQLAIGINKAGDMGAFFAAIKEYWKSRKIDVKMATKLALIVIICSIIGTQIMVRLDTFLLEKLIGIVILIFLPFFLLNKKIGIRKSESSKRRKTAGVILYCVLAIEGAIIGAGGATVILFLMMYFFGYEIIRGYATNTIPEFFSATIPAVIYFFYGFVPFWPAAVIFAGCLAGGYIGSKTAIRKGNKWVKHLFTIVIIVFVIKILFF